MRTPEGRVADALRAAAQAHGVLLRKLRWEGRVGAPDYLAAYAGRVYFIETKAPGEHPRPSQIAEFNQLARAGLPVAVIDNTADARAVIERIATCTKKKNQDT